VTGLVATDSWWLAAAARQALVSAGDPGVEPIVSQAVVRRQGPTWYCLIQGAAEAQAEAANDSAAPGMIAELGGAGYPAFALPWFLPPGSAGGQGEPAVAVAALNGPLAGLSFAASSPVVFSPLAGEGSVGHGGRTYRGVLRVASAGSSGLFAVVNLLDIEQYLLGVVPSEMPASWPLEALKAQAVAARTYAVANLGKHSSRGFDLCHDVHCQAYLGYGNEYPGPTAAVRATAGMVATYGGRLINAVYHAHSGGATDSSAVIWGSATPYLLGTSRTYEQPYRWTATNSRHEVEQIVANVLGGDLPAGLFPLLAMEPSSFTAGGRATRVNLSGPAATAQITASKLRSGLGTYRLREAKFDAWGVWVASWWDDPAGAAAFGDSLPVVTWAPGARAEGVLVQNQPYAGVGGVGLGLLDQAFFVFSGEGFGHGVGMSQWGAREMAALGKGYREILTNFYSGITIAANYNR